MYHQDVRKHTLRYRLQTIFLAIAVLSVILAGMFSSIVAFLLGGIIVSILISVWVETHPKRR